MFCEKCGKEISNDTVICPNCGAEIVGNKNSKGKVHPMLVGCLTPVIILLVLGIIGAFAPDTSKTTETKTTEQQSQKTVKKPKLEILNSSFCTMEYGSRGICGTVINNSTRNYRYAQVEINLYDNSGNLVGSTMSNINNLEPGKQWKFKAMILENNVSKYEIKDVTGF